jgi:hypothetical protein
MGKQEDNTTLDILEQTEVILDGKCSFGGLLGVWLFPHVPRISSAQKAGIAAVEMQKLRLAFCCGLAVVCLVSYTGYQRSAAYGCTTMLHSVA